MLVLLSSGTVSHAVHRRYAWQACMFHDTTCTRLLESIIVFPGYRTQATARHATGSLKNAAFAELWYGVTRSASQVCMAGVCVS